MKNQEKAISPLPLSIPVILAWLGIWGSWIAHPTAALTQQGLDIAEWATYLLDVRNGPLHIYPELLRGAFGLIAIALCFAISDIRNLWLRIPVTIGGLVTGALLLPPYPGGLGWWMMSFWWDYYRLQLVLAILTLVFCCLSLLPGLKRINTLLTGLTSAGAFILAIISLVALARPFQIHYTYQLTPGWGVIFFLSCSITAAGFSLFNLMAKKNGPQWTRHHADNRES